MKAHDDLTFNVISATMESPPRPPPLAYISQELVAIKRNCLDGTPVASDCLLLRRGWVGGQQAHLSSGPVGFAEGSSTASLFCGAPPRIKLCVLPPCLQLEKKEKSLVIVS